jgi:hypothetical protein
MANIRPNRTGLPVCIWVAEPSGNEKHFARIKVSAHYGEKIDLSAGFFTITIPEKKIMGDTGEIKFKDIELINRFIDLNADLIIQLWNKEIDIVDFIVEMQKI